MKSAKMIGAVALLLVAMFIQTADCYDGQRQGFVFGVGVGPGMLTLQDVYKPDKNYFGLQTDLNIGHGITNQFIIHYSGKQYWSFENQDYTFLTQGNPHISMTYFLKPEAPSFFIGGGFGASLIGVTGSDFVGLAGKASVHGSIGREIAPNYLVEISAVKTFSGHKDFENSWNLMLLLNLLRY